MSSRLWYPQLDVCDAIRRFGLLLRSFTASPGLERLYIADFFLSTPSLLHKTRMTMDARNELRSLKVLAPEKSFVSYPAIPLFFHKMEPFQKQAIQEIRGRSLLQETELGRGNVLLSELGIQTFQAEGFVYTDEEVSVCEFLTRNFLAVETVQQEEFRSRTGLRRPS